jgi:hypothetical protein
MSKKFNVKDIVDERKNELDNSPLFHSIKHASTLKDGTAPDNPTKDNVDFQSIAKSPTPNPIQPPIQQASNKPFVRRTFDFYEEQIKYLKNESLKEQLAGREGSMNAMVREAIDDWINKRASRK